MVEVLALVSAVGGAEVGYRDKELICIECRQCFIFMAQDQAFYAEQGYPLPKRCPSCRAERRQRRQEQHGHSEAS